MRVLSVDPLYAWAIVHGLKSVENRSWRTRHRGPLAIHANRSSRRDAQARAALAAAGIEAPHDVAHGAIVGHVDLIDVFPFSRAGNATAAQGRLFVDQQLAADPLVTGPYCWILANARALENPIPCNGRQRIWQQTDYAAP